MRGNISMGRISMESEAEEITVCSGTTSPKRHVKRSNPYSTSGVDKFQSVYAEFSAKKEYIANKIGEPEATVRFVSSKKRWIPVVIGARDQETGKKNSGAGAAGVSILGPVEKSNSVDHEHEHHNHEKINKFRRPVSIDNRHSTKPATTVQGSDSFSRRTKPTMASDARVGAIFMIITLFCFVFYGRLCAVLFTCAWLYLLPKFREGSEGLREMNRNKNIRMVYLQSGEYKKKVIMDGFMDRTHK